VPRILLLGATGYTGRLTARAMARLGAAPVLAGRDRPRTRALADELGLECLIHTLDELPRLIGRGDVVVNTIGPFARHGATVIDAAVAAGAVYLDCAAEPAHLRAVFARAGAPIPLLTAMGYESVPGILAAELALREAPGATSVAVGYFTTGRFRTSAGTRASFVPAALEPSFGFRDGRLITERGAARVREFGVEGGRRAAISTGMAEHLALPRTHPELREVDAYMGWFGRASPAVALAARAGERLTRRPRVRALAGLAARVAGAGSDGPGAEQRARSGSYVVAVAGGAEVALAGIDGYDFTANILAWAADHALDGALTGTGPLSPVEAFGLEALEAGVRGAGLSRVGG
jgi:short subunit dehydrogenase-like uncharacterized protein